MPPRFGPMASGLDTNIETGEPTQPLEWNRQARQEEARQRAMDRHSQILHDLAGDGGVVLRMVAERLAARIDQLVAQDQEATTLLSLLRSTQRDLALGEMLVARDLEQIFNRDGRPGP